MYLFYGLQYLLFSGAAFFTAILAANDSHVQSTACGEIVNSNPPDDNAIFNASLVYDCLTSVPFNSAVATRFLQYYNDTLRFQSTLTYLKNPPPSYQQPGVDLLKGINDLQQGIDNGIFSNQYEFEAALQRLLFAAHDGHLNLIAGVLAVFSFGSPFDIVSISRDGIELPKVYLQKDLDESNQFVDYLPSPIVSINGIETISYLTEFSTNNSFGTLEPHADWNQLMFSAAQSVQGIFSTFAGGATFYPGDTNTFKLENGTEISDRFFAVYYSQGSTGPLETGGDFYNSFVLGFYPDSYDPELIDNNTVNITDSSASISDNSTFTSNGSTTTGPSGNPCPFWDDPRYPDCADVAQLNFPNDAYVSGYFLNSTSISVLSIPNFVADDDALNDFKATITEFISRSLDAKLKKVVIDLQSNLGGQPLLAIDTFKHFFPNIDPYAGSRMRAHEAANVMGDTLTTYFQTLNDTENDFYDLAASEWVATRRINADTGVAFTSWPEFFGPHLENGDGFTTTQRYNLSDSLFVEAAAGYPNETFTIYGTGSDPISEPNTPPFAADDIIILSDGVCASACSLFMELMHHEAGVKVVAVGGRPSTGPMQAPSGTRGALAYDTIDLDLDVENTQTLLSQSISDVNYHFLPSREEALDVYVSYATINLRDQTREGETIPLQFAYEAADCRIFYTPQTSQNYSALWQYAANAIWSNSTLCVEGSTGFATTGRNTTDFVGPAQPSGLGTFSLEDITGNLGDQNSSIVSYSGDGIDGYSRPKSPRPNLCDFDDGGVGESGGCKTHERCVWTSTCGDTKRRRQCIPECVLDSSRSCNAAGAKCTSNIYICESGTHCTKLLSDEEDLGVCPPKTCLSQQKGAKVGVGPGRGSLLGRASTPSSIVNKHRRRRRAVSEPRSKLSRRSIPWIQR